VGFPFLGAIACLAGRDRGCRAIGVLATLLTFAAAIGLALKVPASTYLFGEMPWLGAAAARGLFGYQLDPLASIMLLASSLIGVAIAIYSAGYLSAGNRDHPTMAGQARYYFWLMLFVGSMIGIAISPTLLQLFFFWEMTTLCSWALISFYDDSQSLKAGMKALMMTSFGGLFFLCGLVWVFSATGSMDFSALGQMSPGMRAGAFALFVIAAWAKSAQLPFHTWLPEAMAAPTPISAYLHAAAMVKAGVFLMARLLLAGWSLPTGMGLLLSVAALVTMFAALYLFFFQDDLKRLLAYSTIAQLAYIFLGLGVGSLGSTIALRGGVLHILMHAFAKTTLFLTVGGVAYATGTRSISRLSGLASRMPIAAASFFVGAFALTGIPPLACFWSKLYILMGALQVPGAFGPIALVLALVESLISFGWFLWVGQRVFWGKERIALASEVSSGHEGLHSELLEAGKVLDPPSTMYWVLIGMVFLTLLIPIVGIPLVSRLALP
jgi:hydrogenase-4 component D